MSDDDYRCSLELGEPRIYIEKKGAIDVINSLSTLLPVPRLTPHRRWIRRLMISSLG